MSSAPEKYATWAFEQPRRAIRAAVLCPGPSLTQFPGRDGYDLVIGVNRAAGYFPCDYWAMLDATPFFHCKPLGNPAILCQTPEWVKVQRFIGDMPEPRPRHRHIAPEDVDASIAFELRTVPARFKYSLCAAITLAHSLGASAVDVYGADWRGVHDYDGRELAQNCRDARRWELEQQSFEVLATSLQNFGTKVRRIVPQEVVHGD
jgi:hypothetical protein